ncbi:hypothetical protein ACFVR1_07345 [Psychrobacillus sp. NPDC058041]|uniref:hypothetical protein n=1 Tax=Psychrobacillus sp. NPDC058041 TaxID=3346310 RepID=UPI0036DA6BBD
MGIDMCSLVFNNVLTYEVVQKKEDWQEGITIMEDTIVNKDVYKNGPLFFSFSPNSAEGKTGKFTYYLPINSTLHLTEESNFSFQDSLILERALLLRQQDIDFYSAYETFENYANFHQIELDKKYYCVLLEVYDDYIADFYVPIKEQGDE